MRMRLDNLEKSDEQEWGDNEEEEESAEQKLLKNIMRVTQDVINSLVQRRSLTWRDMKKRAKRKYLKELKVNDGPYVSTLALATQISIMIGGPEAVQEKIIGPYKNARWTKGVIDPSIINMVEAASSEEAVVSADEDDSESDESSTDESASNPEEVSSSEDSKGEM